MSGPAGQVPAARTDAPGMRLRAVTAALGLLVTAADSDNGDAALLPGGSSLTSAMAARGMESSVTPRPIRIGAAKICQSVR